jgi:hypothetical protein
MTPRARIAWKILALFALVLVFVAFATTRYEFVYRAF